MVEAEDGERQPEQLLDAAARLGGVLVELGRDEVQHAVAGVHHEVRAEDHAGVVLEEQRVVRPLGAGRAHGDEAAGEHVAVP